MRLVVLGALLVTLAACGGGDDDPHVGTWTVDGSGAGPAEAGEAPYVVLHDDGRAEGFDGCNSGSGQWSVEGGGVVLGEWISTLRGCLGSVRVADFGATAVLAPDGETLEVPATDGGEPFRLTRVG